MQIIFLLLSFLCFNQFLRDRITDDYFGVDSSLSYSDNFYLLDVSVYDIKNLLTTSLRGKDESLVQLKPRVRLNLKPINIFQTVEEEVYLLILPVIYTFLKEADDLNLTRDYTRARNEINLFENINTQDYLILIFN